MRRSAIVVTCALLVAALLSPGVAMAKGGNGRHSVATPRTSENEMGEDRRPDPGKKAGRTAKPTAASPQGKTAKNVEKPTRETPRAEKSQSATREQPAGAMTSTKAVPNSPASTRLAEGRISSDTVGESGIETRGVLDTIRVKVNASLEGIRAIVAGVWSAVTSWFGD